LLPHVPVDPRASHAATLLAALGYLLAYSLFVGAIALFLNGGNPVAALTAAAVPFDLSAVFLVAIAFGTTLHGLCEPRGKKFLWAARAVLLLLAAVFPLALLFGWDSVLASAFLAPFQALALLALAPMWGGPLSGAGAALVLIFLTFVLAYAPVAGGRSGSTITRDLRRQGVFERAAARQAMPNSVPMFRSEFDALPIRPGPVAALRSLVKIPWALVLYSFSILVILIVGLVTFLPAAAQVHIPLPRIRGEQAAAMAYLFGLLMVSTMVSVVSSEWSSRIGARFSGEGRRMPSWRRPTPGAAGILRWDLLQTLPYDRRMVSAAVLRPSLAPLVVLTAGPTLLALLIFPDGLGAAVFVLAITSTMLLMLGVRLVWGSDNRYYGPRESRGLSFYKSVLVGMWGGGMIFSFFGGFIGIIGAAFEPPTLAEIIAFAALVVGGAFAMACALLWRQEQFIVLTRPFDGASKFGALTAGAVIIFVLPVSLIVAQAL
jgi:hypothetical protein